MQHLEKAVQHKKREQTYSMPAVFTLIVYLIEFHGALYLVQHVWAADNGNIAESFHAVTMWLITKCE